MFWLIPVIWAATVTTVAVATANSNEEAAKASYLAAQQRQEEENRRLIAEVQKTKADAERRLKNQQEALLQAQAEQMSSIVNEQIDFVEYLVNWCKKLLLEVERKIKNTSNESNDLKQLNSNRSALKRFISELQTQLCSLQELT
ncbi:MAG: hypothetical protein JNM36_16120 [Chitinophagales bacterium]|nr:hypothetical protein [Chitinophagales bacterium]